MELLICGSGASEAIPALFCTCPICRQARKNGGKDIRSRTAYQLGDDIRIDFGPDLFYQREKFNLDFSRLKHLFITHPHKDHFTPIQLNYHIDGPEGPAILGDNRLCLHGTAQVIQQFKDSLTVDFSRMQMDLDELNPQEDVRELQNGMRFTSIRARHCPGAVNYIIEIPNGKTLFIGTDSAQFLPETWEQLSRFHLDVVILDGTAGLLNIENGSHMNARQAAETAERMRQKGIAGPDSEIYVNHFAHCAGMLHEDLVRFYTPYHMTPAWDGLRIKLDK